MWLVFGLAIGVITEIRRRNGFAQTRLGNAVIQARMGECTTGAS